MIVGALLAFALWFDEIVATFFLIGLQTILRLWVLIRIRSRHTFSEVDVIALVIITVTVPRVLLAQYFSRTDTAALRPD